MPRDQYEIESLINSLASSIEDLTHRMYTIEDSIAGMNAFVEELNEYRMEEEDA